MSTLLDIRRKVRQLTGRKSPVNLTDAEIDFQVNNWYQFEMPLEFRTLDLRFEYQFTTNPNVDVYDLSPNIFTSFEPQAYVEGYPTLFVQDRSLFHRLYPDIRNDVLLVLATGITGPYTGFISATPILKGSVLVYGQTSFSTANKLVDDSNGNLVILNTDGSLDTVSQGSINYETGEITNLIFQSAIPTGNEIRVQSRQYNPNRPTTVFYWDQQFTLRPVPDRPYNIRVVGYRLPTELLASNESPPFAEWWEALAYAASMKIFENNKDLSSASEMNELLERKILLLGRRDWFYLRTQRTSTIYNQPAITSNPGLYFGYFGQGW
ncbi:MAG: phage adaptor protein [Rhodanobacter sp.]